MSRADARRPGSSSVVGGPQRMRHTLPAASSLRPTGARASARDTAGLLFDQWVLEA
jgi:hypothetical protein